MSHPPLLSLTQLKRLTAFIEAQDGSQTQKELLPLMRGPLSVRGGLPPTEETVAEAIQAIQLRARHRLENQRRREAGETSAAQQAERAANTRATRRKTVQAAQGAAAGPRLGAAVKKVEATPQTRAEDKLHATLADLRARNAQYSVAQRADAIGQRKQQAAAKKAERQQEKAKEAAERKAERERTAKQRADELELKAKVRDQRALQQLTAAARQRLYEERQKAAFDRQERIDGKMEHLIDLEVEVLEDRRGQKRAREEDMEEPDDDKENDQLESEWRV